MGARYSPTAIETGTRRIGRNTKPRPTQMVAFIRPLDFRTFAASMMASHDWTATVQRRRTVGRRSGSRGRSGSPLGPPARRRPPKRSGYMVWIGPGSTVLPADRPGHRPMTPRTLDEDTGKGCTFSKSDRRHRRLRPRPSRRRAVGGGLGGAARDHGDIPRREPGAARVPGRISLADR
jgi:hypothetical protein